MNRKPAAVNRIGLIVELLKELGVEHTDDEIERTVVVWDNRKHCCLSFADGTKVHLIGLRNACKRI